MDGERTSSPASPIFCEFNRRLDARSHRFTLPAILGEKHQKNREERRDMTARERKKADNDYFQEGQEAHRHGKPRSANPYETKKDMRDAASYWDQGWASEQKAGYGDG